MNGRHGVAPDGTLLQEVSEKAKMGPMPPAQPPSEDYIAGRIAQLDLDKPMSGRGLGLSGWYCRAMALMTAVAWGYTLRTFWDKAMHGGFV